jgi:hypothetical protein
MFGDFTTAARAVRQVCGDDGSLVGACGVDRIGAEEFLDLGVREW